MTQKTEIKGFSSITPEEMQEWIALEGEELRRGLAYRKACKKADVHPTPPSQWIKCPLCDYRTPGSLVSHYTNEHGGRSAVARQLGVLEEDVPLVTDDMMVRFAAAGAKAATAAKKNGNDSKPKPKDEAPDLAGIV